MLRGESNGAEKSRSSGSRFSASETLARLRAEGVVPVGGTPSPGPGEC